MNILDAAIEAVECADTGGGVVLYKGNGEYETRRATNDFSNVIINLSDGVEKSTGHNIRDFYDVDLIALFLVCQEVGKLSTTIQNHLDTTIDDWIVDTNLDGMSIQEIAKKWDDYSVSSIIL